MTSPRFPETRVSIIERLRRDDPEQRRDAGDLLVRAYRAPILATLRWRWNLELVDAEDLTQSFLATALEKRWFEKFDPARGRFRTFIRMAADRFAANARQAASRQKRGGEQTTVPLDSVDLALVDGDEEIERRFRDEWVRSVFELALGALRVEATARDRLTHIALFEQYDIADEPRPTYSELGVAYALSESAVINHLAWARRRFRTHVLDVLKQLAGSDEEYREDVRDLLGMDAP